MERLNLRTEAPSMEVPPYQRALAEELAETERSLSARERASDELLFSVWTGVVMRFMPNQEAGEFVSLSVQKQKEYFPEQSMFNFDRFLRAVHAKRRRAFMREQN